MGTRFIGHATAAALCVIVAIGPARGDEAPPKYVMEYPAAELFCPPVAGFFGEVERTIDRVGYRTFRHQPNGGYGLPVVDMVGGQHLLHLGADVGWHRVGEPVFAVANGVVRVSQGENVTSRERMDPDTSTTNKAPSPQPSPMGRGSKQLAWGNLIVLEHHLPDGKYATTIYGHLASERLVKVGDVMQAGQQIGTIGATRVNGGYKPHLHFGVREGRMAEPGRKLILMSREGKALQLEISEVRDQVIVLSGGTALPDRVQIGVDGRKFDIRKQGDKAEVDLAFLQYVPSPDFLIVGYGLSTDGWLDPVAFLKAHGADINPAPFGPAPRRRSQAR
jgi:murein DD-endopeptidase MepM/ murein hydrolase activator NlpD